MKKGILLGVYITRNAEPFVRAQLDRGELRYTWKDIHNNARASDDGGELPPKDWWRRPEFTMIDYEQHSVRGNAMFGPTFPMYFVQVYPTDAPAETGVRPSTKANLVWAILAEFDRLGRLASNLPPAGIEKLVLPEFRRRWRELRPDDDTGGSVSRTVIYSY